MVAPAAALAGSISGTVTDAATSDPIEAVEVCAYMEEEDEEWDYGCALTGAGGAYSIPALEPGSYFVEIWAGGLSYRGKWFEEVAVGDGDTVVDAELEPTASISGAVLAVEDGLGVEEVEVCAYDVVNQEYGGCDETGPDGKYLIPDLIGSEYKVEFWTGWTGRNLAFQYYDHENRWDDGAILEPEEGEALTGIDADLQPGATISGNLTSAASGQPLEEVRVCSIDAFTAVPLTCTWSNSKGNYFLRLLTDGGYKVAFSPELREFFPESGPEDDGIPTEFWDNQTSLAAANPIGLLTGGSVGGINAQLGSPPAPPPAFTPPPAAQPPVTAPRKRKCRRGFRKKRIKGKVRCVKARKHRKHRQRGKNRQLKLAPASQR
ncbi:MAG TPA: carboxypeptidase-like regulatory domain-containing protein [Solirubrobacterales bacterium]|nr:carboxypeptidase-like regulatory domain-containing protein [Solirubrobacterales bacterium]